MKNEKLLFGYRISPNNLCDQWSTKHIGEKHRRGTNLACCMIYLPLQRFCTRLNYKWGIFQAGIRPFGTFSKQRCRYICKTLFFLHLYQILSALLSCPAPHLCSSQSWAAKLVMQNSLKIYHCTPNPLSNWLRRKQKPVILSQGPSDGAESLKRYS